MDKGVPFIRPRHSWSFFKGKCLHCNQFTRERVIHYFHIVKRNGLWKSFPVRNAEHYLCHQQTCIDWRCIKLREEIRKAAEEATEAIGNQRTIFNNRF